MTENNQQNTTAAATQEQAPTVSFPGLPDDYAMPEGFERIDFTTKGKGKKAETGHTYPAPTLQAIVDHEETLISVLKSMRLDRLRYFVRREIGLDKVPVTVADFFAPMRREASEKFAGLREIKKLATKLVKALAKKSGKFAILDAGLLVKCLESKSFAETLFPETDQAVWERCIALLVEACQKAEVDTGLIVHWSETRDTVDLVGETEEDEGEFDLDDLTV